MICPTTRAADLNCRDYLMSKSSAVRLGRIRLGESQVMARGNAAVPSGEGGWPMQGLHQRLKIVYSLRAFLPTTFILVFCSLAQAEDAVLSTPTQNEAAPAAEQPSISTSIPALGEFKKALLDLDYNVQLNYIGEVLGNTKGGVRQRTIYDDLIELAIDGDLSKIAGLNGASFHINAFQIDSSGLSTCCIFNFMTVSNIEARPSTRLFEAWFEQKLFGEMASIRIGQLAANTEFTTSDFSALYLNATFGWPNILAADLPSGGPNYPLATPGVRLKVSPDDQITFIAALFNGDPSGAGFTGLQETLDPAGINFRLRDPPLLMTEAQYKYNQDKDSPGLAGTIKFGAWYHFGKFNDQRYGVDGLSLAHPSSKGNVLTHQGDYGAYGMIDQMIWRLPGNDPKKGVGGFALVSASPSDRNFVDFYAEGGITFIGVWDSRPDDAFGFAAAYSPLSPSVRGLDADTAFFAKAALPIRSSEMLLELTYQAQIIPGLIVQPDFQYIFRPGAGIVDPFNPYLGRIRDAAVFGMRVGAKF